MVADNVAAVLGGRRARRFRYRTLGVFVDMGRHKAVATMLGVRLRLRRLVRGLHLPHADDARVRPPAEPADWTVGLFFGRASAELGQLGHPPSLGTYLEREAEGQPPVSAGELSFREGRPSDLRATFELAERSPSSGRRSGIMVSGDDDRQAYLREEWSRQRPLLEFIAAQPEGQFFVCESGNEIVGHARVARFGQMDASASWPCRPSTPGEALPFSSAAGPSRRAPGWAGSS